MGDTVPTTTGPTTTEPTTSVTTTSGPTTAGQVPVTAPAPVESFRRLSRTDLNRVYVSLGLPREAFRASAVMTERRPFDAVVNAHVSHPNGLWLFKGSDYYLYDLARDEVVEGPTPLTTPWGNGALPELFRTGVHSVLWGASAGPDIWVFFKDEMYYAMRESTGFAQHEGPRGVLGVWAAGAWTNPDGTWRTPGVPVALHGVGSRYDGTAHFFKDGEYLRHDLRTGGTALAPVPIGQVWNLPEPFLHRIDYAFYGAGAQKELINFVSGDRYVLYDFRLDAVVDDRPVEDRFPVFSQFVDRPQLFLGEDYTLEALAGPTSLGRLIETRTIGAGSRIKKVLVVHSTDSSRHSITQSLLESQDADVTEDFYDKLDTNLSSSDSSDNYRYQLNAQFHGDASASGVWGGEVNAQLAAQGQTETVRSSLAQAAFRSIGSQQRQAQHNTKRQTYDSADQIDRTLEVLRTDEFEEVNDSPHVRVYEFYEQLQAYLTLLVLQGAVVVYSDGVSQPRVAQLPQVRRLLESVLVDPAQVTSVLDYLRQELSQVTDHEGLVRSLLADNAPPGGLVARGGLSSAYTLVQPDGRRQEIPVNGIITAVRSWIEPTFTITCVQR